MYAKSSVDHPTPSNAIHFLFTFSSQYQFNSSHIYSYISFFDVCERVCVCLQCSVARVSGAGVVLPGCSVAPWVFPFT